MTRLSLLLAVLAGCAFEGAPGDLDDSTGSGSNDSGTGSGSACAADIDSDGTCDNVDDWLCGPAKPEDPGETAGGGGMGAFWNVWNVGFDNSRILSVAAGAAIQFSFDYRAGIYCGQGGGDCTSQLELGTPTTLVQCAAAIVTDKDQFDTKTANASGTLTLPARAEAYEMRLNLGVDTAACPTSYSDGEPDSDPIAFICVR